MRPGRMSLQPDADPSQQNANGHILVMDDEDMIRHLLQNMLARLGYETESVSDGDAALVAYQQANRAGRPFAVVILDALIPGGMGGFETIAHLRTIDPQIRAVLCSGYSYYPGLANYSQHGFCGLLAKPFTLLDLSGVLQAALSRVGEGWGEGSAPGRGIA